jgi:hypothetical protein
VKDLNRITGYYITGYFVAGFKPAKYGFVARVAGL